MCGLFGFSGKQPDLQKLKMLGIINTRRGTDSCGVYINEPKSLLKGVDNNADFVNFIGNNDLIVNKNTTLVIGHTRKSTVGLNTFENAHPYIISDSMIGAHNGSLTDWKNLCAKFNLNSEKYNVDSQALLDMINVDAKRALKLYNGAAALLYSNNNQLNVYRGASLKKYPQTWNHKDHKWESASELIVDERPMFALQTTEGVYFSSLYNSLKVIASKNDTFIELNANTVYTFEEGLLIDSFTIERKPFVGNAWNYNDNTYNKSYTKPLDKKIDNKALLATTASVGKTYDLSSVLTLKLIKNKPLSKNFVYFDNFRYKLKNKLLHGSKRIHPTGQVNTKFASEYFFYKGILLSEIMNIANFHNVETILDILWDKIEKKAKENIKNLYKELEDFRKVISEFTTEPLYIHEYTAYPSIRDEKDRLASLVYTSLFNNNKTYTIQHGDVIKAEPATIFDVDDFYLFKYGSDFWEHLLTTDTLEKVTLKHNSFQSVMDVLEAFGLNQVESNDDDKTVDFVLECMDTISEAIEDLKFQTKDILTSNTEDFIITLEIYKDSLHEEFDERFAGVISENDKISYE